MLDTATTKKLEGLVPIGLTRDEYLELALMLLDQADVDLVGLEDDIREAFDHSERCRRADQAEAWADDFEEEES